MHTNSLVKHSPVPAMLHDQSTEYEMLFNPKIYHNRKFLVPREVLQSETLPARRWHAVHSRHYMHWNVSDTTVRLSMLGNRHRPQHSKCLFTCVKVETLSETSG
ncbi:hypothetical protein HBI56_116040 [Parastagonospora nodorum]|uniref:Uncharacterized protein n=1 Tax=Phaeosphaeria nodorum (strain SN15 / ATCC MYA-4574 / FGSC 10173) TaxID=321614 RepID=A0A7U2F8E7_PHANO|nr:hypothetical protein HBH56_238550 [Parastagonospora nodorum]QRD00659.1 hypothetical protein JI435_415590 [Parastagonospora nodorum SN15]KAH3925825.1 hypothetical protein HBH54_177340 [Parastagonospora nodorum]KAH3976407.1 hypothetical protein HBH52_119930 [Parastagonospora nodorum]KAH4000544.1 hypothetical protein HBI10_101630 [Parastagonospora nodorum]